MSDRVQKGLKRKMVDNTLGAATRERPTNSLRESVKAYIKTLKDFQSWEPSHRMALWHSSCALAEIACERVHRKIIVKEGGIDALIPHLCAPLVEEGRTTLWKHTVERAALLTLGRIVEEPEYRLTAVSSYVLPRLAPLLLRRVVTSGDYDALLISHIIQRATRIVAILSQKNKYIQDQVRKAGVISSLLALLDLKSTDTTLQKEALKTLQVLTFKNAVNRNRIVDWIHKSESQTLIFMMQSGNDEVSKAAIGTVESLLEDTPVSVKNKLLQAGVLRPIVRLLTSSCPGVQSQAASILYSFALMSSAEGLVVKYAIRPLIKMLKATDQRNQAKALIILGELARTSGNHAGIIFGGGLKPLLGHLDSPNDNVQVSAAFALCVLAGNEDNTSDIVEEGGVQQLQDADFASPLSKACAQIAFEWLKTTIHGNTLKHLLYLMGSADEGLQGTVACALAYLCSPNNWRSIFVVHSGLAVLLDMLNCRFKSSRQQMHGAEALHKLVAMEIAFSNIHSVLPPVTPPVVYLGEDYLNSRTSSDLTFLVEGIPFYAHKAVLCASSDIFRAMLEGEYREKDLSNIPIIDISWNDFALMMRHIYTGTIEVTVDEAQDLFRAADQYLLDGLKGLCEDVISRGLTVENVTKVFGLAKAHQVPSLQRSCVLFILGKHEEICDLAAYPAMMESMIPGIREYLSHILS